MRLELKQCNHSLLDTVVAWKRLKVFRNEHLKDRIGRDIFSKLRPLKDRTGSDQPEAGHYKMGDEPKRAAYSRPYTMRGSGRG